MTYRFYMSKAILYPIAMSNKAKGQHWVKPERTAFRNDTKVQEWLHTLYPSTRNSYEYDLYRLCTSLNFTGTSFLEAAEKEPKETSRKVKAYLKQLEQEYNGMNAARCKAAMVSYLNYFEIEPLPLAGLKIKQGKAAPHPLLRWEDADRIISVADSKYQPAFRLMQWALDAERLVEVNNNPDIITKIGEQLKDETRDFIKIPISKRKNNPNAYYVMVPRQLAAYLPIRTTKNEPLQHKWNIQHQWRQTLRRSGLPIDGAHGAHNLRSCWLTEATKRGLDPVLREFQLGHTVDALNYQRTMQDDAYVIEQYRKAWQIQPIATKEELEASKTEIESLRKQLETIRTEQQASINEAAKSIWDSLKDRTGFKPISMFTGQGERPKARSTKRSTRRKK